MGRDDTFPLQDARIRVPFRDMTTQEAEYHAETMWPYYVSKVSDAVDCKVKACMHQIAYEEFLRVIADVMGLNASSPADRDRLKSAFRILRLMVSAQQFAAGVCIRCLLPWSLAAAAGVIGILFKDNVPHIGVIMEHIRMISRP